MSNDLDLLMASSQAPGLETPRGPLRKIFKHLEGDDYVLQIDNSSLEVVTTCARAAEYQLVYSRVGHPKSALTYGSAIHAGLEAYYKNEPREKVFRDMANVFAEGPNISDWRTPDRAMDCMDDYMRENPKELQDFEVLFGADDKPLVEIGFSIPLGVIEVHSTIPYPRSVLVADAAPDNDEEFYIAKVHVFWTGKIDQLVESGSRKWVMDHKTSSISTGQYFDDFILSQQTLGYTWAGEQILGEPVMGLILNLIMGRPKTRTGTWQAFERRRYLYPEHRKVEWPINTLYLISDFVSYLKRGYFPMMTKWCIGKYGKCPFFNVCTAKPEDRPSILSSHEFQDNTWTPLKEIDGE